MLEIVTFGNPNQKNMLIHFLRKVVPLLSILILATSVSFAQTGNIRGFVYEKETGEPVIFTNVIVKGTTLGASTDVNGYYQITKVPAGDHIIEVTYLGYETVNVKVSLKAGEIANKRITLEKSTVSLKAFSISADKQEAKTEVRNSVVAITPKDIKQVPTVGGEADLAQYLQVLPGVIFTGDQGGQLYIRGGSPVQNKVLMDGMIIYNPFHSIGLFSVFDTDIIRNADIYTGGFGAEYGGRISSIMDIKTRDGNKKRISGKVAASTFGTKTLIEGPIFKQKEDFTGGSSSFIVSAKNSYLAQSSRLFYTYADTAGLPFNFSDYYGKVSFSAENGSKINLFGFSFNDKVKYQAISDLNWKSFGGGSNFVLVPTGTPMLVEGNFAYSSYDITMEEKDLSPRRSKIDGFNLGLNFTYYQGENELKYGLEVLGFQTEFEFFNSLNRKIEQNQNTTEFGAFVKYKFVIGNLVVDPSFRAQYYASMDNFSPEPRLGAKYNIGDRFRIKASGGLYSQNLISAVSDRDVVNLFYGFLSGSDNIPGKFTDKDGTTREVTHKLQKANHLILGTEIDLTKNITLNVEVYNKNFTQLTNINRNKIFNDDNTSTTKPDELKKDFIIETGTAKGIDFLLKYDIKKLYVWVVYSMSYVDRWDGKKLYYPVFDRRHNVNFVASYTFGKDLNWEFDARWNYGTGFPFTPTQGFYENNTFSGGTNTDYTSTNGELGIIYGDLNSQRLPTYHRLDLTLKRKFEISQRSTLETVFSVTNAYNRENIFYFDRVRYERVNQLPILPSLGMSLTF
ncbi:MAG TPA: carboxypeptidase-like regulatory domain-containing protein [Bacteroidia bacterium]|nr:carboxypeptidase-like regulatory domain-containing protein [Bacteroidia bacterium]